MFASFLHWIIAVTAKIGYVGILIAMTIESTFLPLPSEIVLPPAGYLAAKGEMELWLIIFFATVGSVLGALLNYWLAYYFGRQIVLKMGRFVGLTEKRYEKIEKFFRDHGEVSTFLGRLIAGVRHFISFPAGVSRMKLSHFIFFTALGGGLWSAVLTLLGFYVGSDHLLFKKYYREVVIFTVIFCVMVVAAYFWWHKRRKAGDGIRETEDRTKRVGEKELNN
jgi:membrane protein DedA with SNARE-associated domain